MSSSGIRVTLVLLPVCIRQVEAKCSVIEAALHLGLADEHSAELCERCEVAPLHPIGWPLCGCAFAIPSRAHSPSSLPRAIASSQPLQMASHCFRPLPDRFPTASDRFPIAPAASRPPACSSRRTPPRALHSSGRSTAPLSSASSPPRAPPSEAPTPSAAPPPPPPPPSTRRRSSHRSVPCARTWAAVGTCRPPDR